MIESIKKDITEHLDESISDLERLCAQPSISAQNIGLDTCSRLVQSMLDEAGLETEVMSVPGGPPIVTGVRKGTSNQTILFYDHYDVQPPEPLELWTSDPFKPQIRDERFFARGASDDKGNLAARIAAIKAYMRIAGDLPISVKFFVEGEEEVGSPHLSDFFEANASHLKNRLAADGCIWEGGGVTWDGSPVMHLGLKGILYLELEARGPNRDLHSSYGAVVPNPAWTLMWALSTIKDRHEKILIPGFYDDVREPTREELLSLNSNSNEDQSFREDIGIESFVEGASGSSYGKRLLLEPACSICGIQSGYTGHGAKTVLPSIAKAKIDFRLVPNQRPEDIKRKLKDHLAKEGFDSIKVTEHGSTYPARTPMNSQWAKLVQQSAERVYKKTATLLPGIAGSGPMYPFTDILHIPTITTGVGYPDNRIHAPNENIRLEDYMRNIMHIADIMHQMSKSR